MEIRNITLIDFQYNCYNGVTFEFINIGVGGFDGCLLGFELSPSFFNIHLLFFYLEIKKPWTKFK